MAKENKQEETLTQMQPSADKLRELKNEGYIDNSTAVVGYANRQEQYDAYGDIVSFIPQEASILDFGCGRGGRNERRPVCPQDLPRVFWLSAARGISQAPAFAHDGAVYRRVPRAGCECHRHRGTAFLPEGDHCGASCRLWRASPVAHCRW